MRTVPVLFATSAVAFGVVVAPVAAGATHGPHASKPVVVVSGLNNPRQLALVGRDELLIAEAGKGGGTEIQGPEGPSFIGTSGSISAVLLPQFAHDTAPHRLVTGLMSGADKNGAFAIGSDGVASRSSHGPIYIQETFFPPDQLPSPLATTQNGRLLSARPYGTHLRRVANIAAFEQAHDPDGLGVDSDPYAVLARRDGSLLVADAAANDVLSVDRWGHIRVFHVFPNVTTGACASHSDPDPSHPGCNYVPTSLATDRFGHVYVGGLSSLTPNEARVTELSANGRHVLHVWTGFTAVTGVAVARNGTLYVSQLMAPEANPPAAEVTGVLTRVHHGQRTDLDVPFPAGLALDRHGRLYVAAWSVAPESGLAGPGTSGQVWRLRF